MLHLSQKAGKTTSESTHDKGPKWMVLGRGKRAQLKRRAHTQMVICTLRQSSMALCSFKDTPALLNTNTGGGLPGKANLFCSMEFPPDSYCRTLLK